MSSDTFVHPMLGGRKDLGLVRLLGPGLGNLLFPWARGILLARDLGVPCLWPTWPQMKLGPWLRRERDKRWYGGLFANPGSYVAGFRKLWLLLRAARVDEDRTPLGASDAPRLIQVRGVGEGFEPLKGRPAWIRRELLRITRPEHTTLMQRVRGRDEVAVHVRRADFRSVSRDALRAGVVNARIPLEWFELQVMLLRRHLGQRAFGVYSDADESSLGELTGIPGVELRRSGSSIGDLLAMSMSSALVASGSTFAMWATFLGRLPTIWFEGQRRDRLTDCGLERGFSTEPLPKEFVARVRGSTGRPTRSGRST